MGRDKGHLWAGGTHGCLGTASPQEAAAGNTRQRQMLGKQPSSAAASQGDKGPLSPSPCSSTSWWGAPREELGLWPRCRRAEGSPPPSPRCPAERTHRQDGWKRAWEGDEQTSARPPHRAPASLEGKGCRGAVARSLPRGNRCRRPGPGISRHCHGVPRDLQVAEAAGSRPAPAVPPRIILGILF